jgi:hypothetical protein
MWVMGGSGDLGSNLNDVWSSPDGTNWTQVTNAAAWSARYSPAGVVLNDRIWLMGGVYSSTVYTNDVWLNAPSKLGLYYLFEKK